MKKEFFLGIKVNQCGTLTESKQMTQSLNIYKVTRKYNIKQTNKIAFRLMNILHPPLPVNWNVRGILGNVLISNKHLNRTVIKCK